MNRPTSVTVFGVLNLVFGCLGVLGLIFAATVQFSGAFPLPPSVPTSGFYAAWTEIMLLAGIAMAIALGISGIGLLLLRSWGRVLAVAYSFINIITTIASMIVQWVFITKPMLYSAAEKAGPEATGAKIGAVLGIVGGLLGLIYPVLLWYFMTRPKVVAAFRGIPQPQGNTWDPAVQSPRSGDLSNPYVSPEADTSQAWSDQPGGSDSILETFVPSKNGPALASYYLGIFSLFPCLGFPLGVAAVYFGVQGLRRVRANPAVRGGAHAWVGLICGSLFGLFNFLLLAVIVVGLIGASLSTR